MEIKKATYLISSPSFDKCPKPDYPEYAFIGRSNVGKSSLINMVTGQRSLAKTSATPGKTQLINHFVIESSTGNKGPNAKWYLVDLPGYGYAKRSQTDRRRWEQMIEGYFRKRENLTQVFVLIDSRQREPCRSRKKYQSVFRYTKNHLAVFAQTFCYQCREEIGEGGNAGIY